MPATLKFCGWDKSALDSAVSYLQHTVRQNEKTGTWDLSNLLMVVPSAQGGRKLLERLAAVAEKRVWIPPEIITPSRLPDKLYPSPRRSATPLVSQLVRMDTLRKADINFLGELVPNIPAENDLSSWWALAQEFGTLSRELAGYHLKLENLLEICSAKGIDLPRAARFEVLATLEDDYHRALSAKGLYDKQRCYLQAIEQSACHYDRPIVLLNTFDLLPVIQSMLRSSGGDITALVHAPQSHQQGFDDLGVLISSYWKNKHLHLDNKWILPVDSQTAQARAVAGNLENFPLGKTQNWEAVTVAMADEQGSSALQRELDFSDIPSRYAGGTSLGRTRPVLFLQALAEFAQDNRARFGHLSRLMRHTDVENYIQQLDSNVNWLAALDQYSSIHLLDLLDGSWPGNHEESQQLIDLYEKLQALLPDDCQVRKKWSQWSKAIADSLNHVYGSLMLDRRKEDDYQLILALETITAALVEVQDLASDFDGHRAVDDSVAQVTFSVAIKLLLKKLAGQSIAAFPDKGVSLVGPLELALDDAPILFVTGLNEGHFPSSHNADSFLPNHVRHAIGINDNQQRYARDFLLLAGAVHSKSQVVLLSPKRGVDGQPLNISRLLLACDHKTLARRVRKFYFEDGNSQGSLGDDLSLKPGTKNKFLIPRSEKDRKIDSLGVTAFRDYLSCPYRFYLKHVVKLQQVDDSAVEMDGAMFGSFLHQVLADFGKSKMADSTDVKLITSFLHEQLEAVSQNQFGNLLRPAVRVQLEQARRRLEYFAAEQAQLADEGWVIKQIEIKQNVTVQVDGQDFTLVGKIDRIDQHAQNGFRIIDYKTASKPKSPDKSHRKKIDGQQQWIDLQLPLYLDLVQELGLNQTGKIELAYFNLPDKQNQTGIDPADWDDQAIASARETRNRVIRHIRAGHFEISENLPQYENNDGISRICQDKAIDRQEILEQSK